MATKKAPTHKYGPPAVGLLIDFETSGSDFGGDSTKSYQGISFGALIFNTETFEELDSLYCEMHFDDTKYKWSADAEKIHGLSREHLAANGIPRDEALAALLSMIVEHTGPNPGKIMFAGHNVKFDIDFTLQLARDFDMEIQPYHVQLDTSSLGFVLAGIFKSDEVFEVFADGATRTQHNALEDARLTLQSMRTMKDIFSAGLTG